jgi:hypothetical protein
VLIAGDTVIVLAGDGMRYTCHLSSVLMENASFGQQLPGPLEATLTMTMSGPPVAVHDALAVAQHAARQAEHHADHYARMLKEETAARLDAEARLAQLRDDLADVANMIKSARQRAK